MKESRKKKKTKIRLNNGKVIKKEASFAMIFSPTVYFRLKYDGIKVFFGSHQVTGFVAISCILSNIFCKYLQ